MNLTLWFYYIILQYILLPNCIIVDYFILLRHDYLFAIVFYYSVSIFIFILLLVFFSSFKFYLILCCIGCFILYLCYCIYHHFMSLFIPRNPLSQKLGKRPTVFIFLFVLVIIFVRGHVLNFAK